MLTGNRVIPIHALTKNQEPLSVDVVSGGLEIAQDTNLDRPKQRERDRPDRVKIEFETRSVVRPPGPCPVCNGQGHHIKRSQYTHQIVSQTVCRYCGGCGRIPRT